MKKIVILFGFLLLLHTSLLSQETLNWRFSNQELVLGSPDQFKFDVEIKSSSPTQFLGALLLFTFNSETFGNTPIVTITGGATFASFLPLGPTIGTGTVSFQLISISGGTPIGGNEYLKFASVTMNVINVCADAGIDFSNLMNGQSFYNAPPNTPYTNIFDNDLLGNLGYTALSTTWTGGVSADWSNYNNWTDCVPGPTTSVLIPDVDINPVVDVNAFANNLTIEPGGALTVPAEFTLTIAGNLLIKSDETGTGSFIHNVTGTTAAIQRNLKGWGSYSTELKNGHGWHLLSSPVAAQPIAPFQDLTDNDDFYKWNEVGNVWNNRRLANNTVNPDFDTDFIVGKGYLVAYEDNKDFTFSGEINVEDIEVNDLTNSHVSGPLNYYGHNLLGNPFTSAVTWGTPAWNRSNVAAHIQMWNEVSGSYLTFGLGDAVPAMQGFFVYVPEIVKGEIGSLTIPASARIHSDQAFYKSENVDQILLVARDLDHQMLQESKLRFDENATSGFDLEFDSYYMAGYAPRFYSLSNNEAYALNTLPEFNEEWVIPFNFEKNQGTNFSIKLEESIEDETIYLTDNKTGLTVNLSENPEYFFTSVEGDAISRFELKFNAVGVDEPVKKDLIQVYVNDDILYLSSVELTGITNVSVIDMLGREVMNTVVLLDGRVSVDVSGLNGAYIVRVVNEREVASTKVIIR